jgi:hypothetical protein
MTKRPLVPLRLLHVGSTFHCWIRVLQREIRSLVRRIAVLRNRRKYRDDVGLGPLFGDDARESSRLSLKTIGRSASIQILISKYPWASDGDLPLALEWWNPGVSFAHYTEGNVGRGIVQALADVVFLEEYEAIRNQMREAMKTESRARIHRTRDLRRFWLKSSA